MQRAKGTLVHRLGMVLFATIFISSTALAQNDAAQISGRITDSQGAVIPGAEVKVVEQSTGTTYTTVSTADGTYVRPGIAPGTYRVEVSVKSFKTAVIPDIELRPVSSKRLDITLEVGQTNQIITVVDKAPTIQTQSPTLTSVSPVQLIDRPISNDARAWILQSLEFFPDSAPGSAWMLFGAGQRTQQEFTSEGLRIDPFVSILPDASVQELQFISNVAPAEYGRPVNVDVTFKGGTNRLHGMWDEAIINPCLNAVNTPFFQYDRAANGGKVQSPCTTAKYRIWRIAGPLIIPKLYDGRNKTFGSFTWHTNPSSVIYVDNGAFWNAPSPEMQAGNFSHYYLPNGQLHVINDPLTGLPFPGNIIPANRINAVTGAWNKYALAPGPGVSYKDQTSYVANASYSTYYKAPLRNWVLRIDQNAGTKDVINYTQTHTPSDNEQPAGYAGYAPRTWVIQDSLIDSWKASEVHSFSPTVVNQLRFGIFRESANDNPTYGDVGGALPGPAALTGLGWLKALGVTGPLLTTAPNSAGAPNFQVTGWPLGTYNYIPTNSVETTYQIFDDVSVVRGKHQMKMGFFGHQYAYDNESNGPFWGNFGFDGRFTGEPYADFLLGYPASVSSTVQRPWIAARRDEIAGYFEDTWAVRSNLTLSMGLRVDTYTPPYDRNDEYYNFDPQNFTIVVPNQKALNSVSPLWPTATLPVVTADKAGYPSKLFNENYNWQPRFGFAWRPLGGTKNVIRGGYGVYSARVLFNQLQTGGPFQITSTLNNSLVPADVPSGQAPQFAFPNPFTAGTGLAPPVNTATGFNVNFRPPIVQNANLTYERVLPGNWGFRASYMLSRTEQMSWSRNLNQKMANTTPYSQAVRPYPQWNDLIWGENGANAIYHSLQLMMSHKWSNGLWLQASYQYRYDRQDEPLDIWSLDESAPLTPYAYNREYDRGPSGNFPTNDFVMNWAHELPVGTGKKYLSDLSSRGFGGKLLNAVVGNWASSGVFTIIGGTPFNPIYTGHDPGNINSFSGQPNLISGCNPYSGAKNVHALWYNPACYAIPANGTLGNAPLNSLVGPGNWDVTFNPYKDFNLVSIKEQEVKLRFGANIYNIFNHPSYNSPGGGVWGTATNDITSGSAGIINSGRCVRAPADWSCNGVRQIMLRAEIMF